MLHGNGFLGREMGQWMHDNRVRHAALFDHATLVKDLAIELARRLAVRPVTARDELLTTLLLRAVSSFEGVILLSERGMLVEARTLTRNAYETAFFIGALIEDETFVKRMDSDHMRHRKTLATELTNDESHRDALGEEAVANIEAFLAELAQSEQQFDRLVSEHAARLAGMTPLYHFFRDLSADAHPTIQSLGRYTDGDTENKGFRLMPRGDCADLALALATSAMYACVMSIREVFDADDIYDRAGELFRWFKSYETNVPV
ncbi:DUF5677 domain-containing protein [Paraburkholderia phenoliruptrix]|uniref:DUF5677 domain-containing protein n=1 Tax=Paraburkholderia phenoliruptrix TaxID=252970 RepID=UPI002869BC84|nr:DUF5677 domain-containing protein [Paraburkholderia phenoliruptrix]WMY11758.1 DUF5677 domain-containing protein [Paraburkholderia phenoliruptrix]